MTTPQNPASDASAHATPSLGDYRRVWDASPLAFVVVDGRGVVTAVSPAGARLFAARSEVLTRQRFLDLVEPMDRAGGVGLPKMLPDHPRAARDGCRGDPLPEVASFARSRRPQST